MKSMHIDLNQFALKIQMDIKIEDILGATKTWKVDGTMIYLA